MNIILGGGIVGMATAYELSQRGVEVTVVDQGQPGYGCSYGNAGWLTPCFSMPLPMPGMLLKSIGWLLDPKSPLYVQPKPSVLLARWMIQFLLAMNEKQMLRSVKALTELSQYSLDRYMNLEHETDSPTHFEQKGLLMVSRGQEGFDAAVNEMNLVARHGVPGKVMNGDEVLEFEPALKGPIRGGVYFPKEAHAEPLKMVESLKAGAIKNGAKVISGCEVFDFDVSGKKITGLHTTRGYLSVDRLIIASGSWSHPIMKRLKISVPILGGKGYSMIVPNWQDAPKVPIMIVERKIAVTPRQGSVRLAGTLELCENDHTINPIRVQAIKEGSMDYLKLPQDFEIEELWRGLRPCTPDGVPMIGNSKHYDNLFYNC